jgi:hypothetical protein
VEVHRKALFVTPFAPLPPVEGHRKRMSATFEALRSIGFRPDVLLLALEHDWIERFDARTFAAMREMCGTFHFVRGRHPEPLAAGTYRVDDWWLPEFEDYARWLFRNVPYDLVLTNYVFTSRVLQLARPNAVRVIETHDLFAGRREMLEGRGMRVEFFHTDAANEGEGLARADLVLAIKEQEEAIFRGYGAREVLTLPTASPPPSRRRRPRAGAGTARPSSATSRRATRSTCATSWSSSASPSGCACPGAPRSTYAPTARSATCCPRTRAAATGAAGAWTRPRSSTPRWTA